MNQIIDIDFFVNRNKVRNYLHFDKKIDDKKLLVYVTNPDKVAQHSFLPTISYLLNEKKIARKKQKKIFRKKILRKRQYNNANIPKFRKNRVRSNIIKTKYSNRLKMRKNVLTNNDFKEKPRLINFPSHIDGNIYAYYSTILGEKYEYFLKNNY